MKSLLFAFVLTLACSFSFQKAHAVSLEINKYVLSSGRGVAKECTNSKGLPKMTKILLGEDGRRASSHLLNRLLKLSVCLDVVVSDDYLSIREWLPFPEEMFGRFDQLPGNGYARSDSYTSSQGGRGRLSANWSSQGSRQKTVQLTWHEGGETIGPVYATLQKRGSGVFISHIRLIKSSPIGRFDLRFRYKSTYRGNL